MTPVTLGGRVHDTELAAAGSELRTGAELLDDRTILGQIVGGAAVPAAAKPFLPGTAGIVSTDAAHAVAIGKRPEPNSRPGYLRVSQGNFYYRHYGPAKRGFDDLVMYNKAPRRGHSCTDKDI